jgi:hypothetical protein
LDIDSISAPICIETISTKLKKGLFASKAEVVQAGVLLTTKWLLLAVKNGDGKIGVVDARLREIQAVDYEKSDFYKLIPDSGVTINGLRTEEAGSGSLFIGLGPEAAAQQFRNELKEAIAKAS